MSLFGFELNSQVNRLQVQTKLQMSKNKFIPNLRTLYRAFASHDQEVSGDISSTSFEKALNSQGVFYKANDIKILQKAFQSESQGPNQVSWFRFLSHLKEPMGPLRRELVSNIYDQIVHTEGSASQENVLKHFQAQNIDLFLSGKCQKQYLEAQLISLLVFDENGAVTKDEFTSFFDDLSFNYHSNEAFVSAVCKHWNFNYQIPKEVTEQEIRSALKALRFKLIQKSGGTKDEFLMRKLFEEYDENRNGFINTYELDLMLKDLEMPTEPRLIEPLLHRLDKNNSGNIEYDELKRFIFFDPFPA